MIQIQKGVFPQMAKKYNLALNPPKKKTELTKDSMLAFMKDKPAEDKKWFVELMNANKKKVMNNLTNEVVDAYDLPPIREAFAQKYFPEISSKHKREAKKDTTKKATSFEDELNALLG